MTRLFFACLLGLMLTTLGCADSTPPVDNDVSAPSPPETVADATARPELTASPAAEPAAGKTIELTPENTRIQFTGIHTGDKPDPRVGSFEKFTGTAVVDGGLKSVEVEIETASLTTEIADLTKHLKSADFFDVNEYPKASFKSTSIKDTGDGMVEITGDLTLLETTKSVTFPAQASTEGDLTLNAEFEIDRSQWGMTYGEGKVDAVVPMKITIGG